MEMRLHRVERHVDGRGDLGQLHVFGKAHKEDAALVDGEGLERGLYLPGLLLDQDA